MGLIPGQLAFLAYLAEWTKLGFPFSCTSVQPLKVTRRYYLASGKCRFPPASEGCASLFF